MLAVNEFRHRLAVVRRLYVLSESSERDRRTRTRLDGCRGVVLHLRSAAALDSWLGALYASPPSPSQSVHRDSTMQRGCSVPSVVTLQCDEALLRGGRLSIAGAMEVVGRLVRLLVDSDAAVGEGAVRAVAFLASTAKAHSTFEKACRSIALKSHLALQRPGLEA